MRFRDEKGHCDTTFFTGDRNLERESSTMVAPEDGTRRRPEPKFATAGVPTGTGAHPPLPGRRLALWWHGLAGLVFGFFVLHPVTMFVFRWLDPRLAPAMEERGAPSLLDSIYQSFRPDMVAMGLVFGVFSAALAVVDGFYRNRLARELEVSEAYRDRLAKQAVLLREKNQQLVRLEEANRRQTQFMVHDFKSHLSGILGFSELLIEREGATGDAARVEALTRIRRQALRMTGAVKDLLDFARLQESPALHRERTPVSKLLEAAAADLSLPTQMRPVEVSSGGRDCPDVAVDVRIIGRVLVNLAFNAIKHNRPGTHVVLDAHPFPTPPGVAFTCTDNGRGLSKAALAKLFDEARERRGTDHDDDESTGFGLAFCKAAVEAHGGRIWCDSSEGQGARFTFTIPLEPEGVRNVDDNQAPHPGRG